jgi:hypothetical protein
MVNNLYKTLFETPENKLKTGIVGMVFITALLAMVFYFEASAIKVTDLDALQTDFMLGGGEQGGNLVVFTDPGDSISGYTNENQETDETVTIETERLVEITCTLTWQDEGSSYFQGTNDPDEFQVSIIAPNDETLAESSLSSSGSASATATLPDYNEKDFEDNYLGSWTLLVTAGNCGDDSAFLPILGLRTTADTGNAWTLSYSFKYKDYETES